MKTTPPITVTAILSELFVLPEGETAHWLVQVEGLRVNTLFFFSPWIFSKPIH